jgi:hypothetical protein
MPVQDISKTHNQIIKKINGSHVDGMDMRRFPKAVLNYQHKGKKSGGASEVRLARAHTTLHEFTAQEGIRADDPVPGGEEPKASQACSASAATKTTNAINFTV